MVKEETVIIILFEKSSSKKATNFKGKKLVLFNVEPSDVHAHSYPHLGTKGRGGSHGTPRRVFDMLQYLETMLPSVESL